MRVIYDISVLGINYRSPYGRAGVFRAVESLASGLAASAECHLEFSASYSLQALRGALDYLKERNGKLSDVPLPHSHARARLRRASSRRALDARWQQISAHAERAPGIRQVLVERLARPARAVRRLLESRYPPVDPNSLQNADIFHSPALAIPMQVRKATRLQRFLTVHDLVPVLYPHFFSASGTGHIKEALKSLGPEDWAICVSEATKSDLCDYVKLDPARAFVTYWAASPDLFYPCTDREKIKVVREKYHIPNAPYLLSLNTLEPRKNLEQAIRAFSELVRQEKISDLHLVLVGARGWNYRSILRAIEESREVKGRIVLTGYVDDGDLAAIYSGALAFVFPSFYEGFGLPPLEAMQCGAPVITSNTSSLPEVVGDAGIMVSPTDREALSEAMLRVYTDTQLREAMSRKSLVRAGEFSWEKCVHDTLAAYHASFEF